MKDLDLINFDASGYQPVYVRNETINLDYSLHLPIKPHLMTDKVQRMPEAITIIRDCLDQTVRQKLLRYLQSTNNWKKSLILDEGGIESEVRSSYTYTFDKFSNQQVNDFVYKILNQAVHFYIQDKPYRHLSGIVDTYYAVRYYQSQEYKVHCDQGPDINRSLSVVFYVNDDYEGGEIYFPNQEITVKPRAGDVILFPSSYTHAHASLPVKSGTKYAIVSWWT